MLNYSIGEFYGILLTFGILVFLSLISLKGIFMIAGGFFDKGIKGVMIHQHHHYRAGGGPAGRDKNSRD